MNEMYRLRVEDSSQVGEVRRRAASMGRMAGLDEVRVEHISIVVTELATNLVKHAHGGELLLRMHDAPETPGIEAISLDTGPGINDIGQSLGDGFSTVKSAGTGLGAIQRLSTVFDIYSKPGEGTAVLSIIRRDRTAYRRPAPHTLDIGVVCVPVQTERSNGDAWAVYQSPERALIMVADGLGHGQHAAEASGAAVAVFRSHPDSGPKELIERMHDAMRQTRGAAIAVAEVRWHENMLRYAGVGNISGRVYGGDTVHNMVSYNGTVGMEMRKIDEFLSPWPKDGLLIMFSDGIATHWNLGEYPGLQTRHASLLAGVLFRDHSRMRDDNTVVAVREAWSVS